MSSGSMDRRTLKARTWDEPVLESSCSGPQEEKVVYYCSDGVLGLAPSLVLANDIGRLDLEPSSGSGSGST